MIEYIKKHYFAVIVACAVGLIYVAPNALFILSLGDEYRGIPMMHTANDDFYIARIQEILDGHPLVGSHTFYEYKKEMPLAPPAGEMLYAIPAMLFGLKPAAVIVASQFLLPPILFLLIYALLLKLFEDEDSFSAKINAIAGALLVTLGYDLIDYHSLFAFLNGLASPGGFLIWARPINPVLGAIFLASFLFFLWRMVEKIRHTEKYKGTLFFASFFLALMISSYFFSWGIAVSILAVLIFIYLIKKEYRIVKSFFALIGVASVLALPYWYFVWQASKSPWYTEALLRNGIFYTHYPLMNKLLILILVVYAVLVVWQFLKHQKTENIIKNEERESISFFQDWHWFTLAFILGPLWAYSQQIITGKTVWPYHFVQYSIPLAMIVLMTLWYRIIRRQYAILWRAGVFVAIIAPLVYGGYVQAGAFNRFYQYDASLQSYGPMLNWLDTQEKDCVVLVNESEKEPYLITGLIPAFTHCDVYASPWSFSLMPIERSYYNYAVQLRMRGITDDHIEEYVKEHIVEARDFIFSDWKDLYGVLDFPDFVSQSLDERIGNFANIYRRLAAISLEDMLRTYRLDYIVSQGTLPQKILNELHGANIVFQDNNLFVYRFNK